MIIKPHCGDRITTMGQQPTDTTEPITLYVRCMFHYLVTAPRLVDVGGIICSVGDDDAVGFIRSVGYTYVPPTAVIPSPLRGFDHRTP